MLIPKFKTTFMGKDITLPEVFLMSSFVPIYREALNSPKFAEKIKTGKYGLCYAVRKTVQDTAASNHFYACLGQALGKCVYLECYVLSKLYVTLDEPSMIDLRLAWADHMVKHMERRQ